MESAESVESAERKEEREVFLACSKSSVFVFLCLPPSFKECVRACGFYHSFLVLVAWEGGGVIPFCRL